MGRIAIAVVADGIDDQLLCDAIIVIKAVERLRVLLRTVVIQLGQAELNKVPNGLVEGADVMEVQRVAVKVLLVVTPCVLGGAEGTKQFIIKSLPFFQIRLTRMEQVKRSILAALGELVCHTLKLSLLRFRCRRLILCGKYAELLRDLPYGREESVLVFVQQQAEHLIPAQLLAECVHLLIQLPPKRYVPLPLIFFRKIGDLCHTLFQAQVFVRRQIQQVGGQHTSGQLLAVQLQGAAIGVENDAASHVYPPSQKLSYLIFNLSALFLSIA